DGNYIWARAVGGTGDDEAGQVRLDPVGNIYVLGGFQNTVDFDPGQGVFNLTAPPGSVPADPHDAFLFKLDAAGNFVWAQAFGGPGNDGPSDIAVDCQGNLYLTGLFQSTADFDPGPGTSSLSSEG